MSEYLLILVDAGRDKLRSLKAVKYPVDFSSFSSFLLRLKDYRYEEILLVDVDKGNFRLIIEASHATLDRQTLRRSNATVIEGFFTNTVSLLCSECYSLETPMRIPNCDCFILNYQNFEVYFFKQFVAEGKQMTKNILSASRIKNFKFYSLEDLKQKLLKLFEHSY